MKAGWKTLPLSKAFWFQEGPGVRKWQFTNSGIKLLNVANIEKNGTLNLAKTDRHLSKEEVESKYSHFLIDDGDLVIASSGISFDEDELLRTRGAFVEAAHLPLCLNTSTIRLKNIEGISDLRFFRFWLDSLEFRSQITRLVTGSAQQNFGPSHLKLLQISLPPIAQQKRIAAILDQAEELRGLRRQALGALDAIVQSIFLEMFGDPAMNSKGWTTLKLGDVIHSAKDGPHVSPAYVEDGIPFLSARHIRRGEVIWADLKFISVEDALVYWRRGKPERGDILYTKGGTTGIAKVIDFDQEIAFWVHIALLKPNHSKVEPRWLENMLNSKYCYQQSQRLTHGIANHDLGLNRMVNIELYLPPLSLQQEFARRVKAIEQLKATHRESLAQLDALFASLQHRAFRGELSP